MSRIRIPRVEPVQIRFAVFIPWKVHKPSSRTCLEHAPVIRSVGSHRGKRKNVTAVRRIHGQRRMRGSDKFPGAVVFVNTKFVVGKPVFRVEIPSHGTNTK